VLRSKPCNKGNRFLKIAAGKQDNRKAPPSNANKEIISIESDGEDSDHDEDSDDDDKDGNDDNSTTTSEMVNTKRRKNQEDSDDNDSNGSEKNDTTKNDQAMETDSTEADNDKNN
jgi:hypothetical protein